MGLYELQVQLKLQALTFRSGAEKGIEETYIKEENKMRSNPPQKKGDAEGNYLSP
jgi:hypothetical protein